MACAVYLQEFIIFTLIFYIVAANHYKSIKSIVDNLYKKINDAKSKQNYKLSTRYPSKDKQVTQQQRLQNQRQIEYCYFSNRQENCDCYSCASNNCYRSNMYAGNSSNKVVLKFNNSVSKSQQQPLLCRFSKEI